MGILYYSINGGLNMATTQYIGARYVPLFFTNPDDNSNNWKSGIAYDPLTVVTDLNQSYTSKIQVPASVGRPSENPTYWIMTGAYSAQVEQYRQEVESYLSEVADFNEASIARDDDLREEAITRDNILRNGRNNHKFIVISDSYGMRNHPSWTDLMVNNFPGTLNSSVGSLGFGTSPNNFLTSIQSLATNMTEEERAEITDIIVGGGWNDANVYRETGGSSISSGINNFAAYCRTNFPNALVHLAFMAWQLPGGGQDGVTITNIRDARRVWMNAIANRNIRYISKCELPMTLTMYQDSSLFHPNTEGSAALFFAVVRGVLGHNIFAMRPNVSLTFESGISIGAVSALCRILDYTAHIQLSVKNDTTAVMNGKVAHIDNIPLPENQVLLNAVNFSTRESYYAVLDQNGDVFVYAGTSNTVGAGQNIMLSGTYPITI